MKELTIVTALLLPIILGLDVTSCNIVLAVCIWVEMIIKWCNK